MIRSEEIYDQRWINLYPSEASAEIINKWGEKEIIGTCQRKAWLRYKIAEDLDAHPDSNIAVIQLGDDAISVMPETKVATREWIFEEGRRIESTILEVAKLAGIYHSSHKKFKIPITNKLFLVGELDGVLKVDGKLIGFEAKSTSGYNAERSVFGTAKDRAMDSKGSPKYQHLLQTAVYAWHYKSKIPFFKLMYFLRGSSLRTEFTISIEQDQITNKHHVLVDYEDTGLTVEQIIDRYVDLANKLEKNEVPSREFNLSFDDDTMNIMSSRNLLSRTLEQQWSKYWDRKINGGRQLKRPEHGDLSCILCPYRDIVCYDNNKQPKQYGIHDKVLHVNVANQTDINEKT
jgi:hypothetical protein